MIRSASRPVLAALFGLIGCFCAGNAEAELGPCTTAAPTTVNVVVFVSDIGRSARWYRKNIGLAVAEDWDTVGRSDSRVTVMARNGVGVTLVSSGRPITLPDPQLVCFVLEEPPAPPLGSAPLFLTDPDGTSVELPPS
jgi:hypothetical protein